MKRLFFPLVFLPAVALAQEAPVEAPPEAPGVEAPAPAKPSVEVSTDLRAEYIQGEPVLVRFTVANTSLQPANFTDLAARPWLVRFELVDKAGKKTTWYTTPPDEDPGGTWSIPPRGQRKVLLEIPSSARLKKGSYTLTVKIQNGDDSVTLPAHTLSMAAANPVHGDTLFEADGIERYGHQTLWVHDAADGYDLYLHHADGKNPSRLVADYHLMHLDSPIEPVLTAARAQERWSRYIAWQSGPRTVEYLRLENHEVRGEAGRVETPYPKVELVGRPSTDAEGGLHVPLWVPAPQGAGGEVMVVSLQGRDGPEYRTISRMDSKPDWTVSTVDNGGNLRLLLSQDGHVDVYNVASGSSLPGAGKRLHKSDDTVPLMGSFGYLKSTTTRAGGLAVLVLFDIGEDLAEARWIGMDGEVVEVFGAAPLPKGGEVEQLVQVGEGFAALHRGESNRVLLPGTDKLVIGPVTQLVARNEDVWVRSIEKGGPVKSRPLSAEAP